MTDEEIVYNIDKITEEICFYRMALKKRYKERRELRQKLEKNHRVKSEL